MTSPQAHLHLIVCDILAAEFTQALAREGLAEATVVPFASCCRPGAIAWERLGQVTAALEPGPRLFVVGPCGTMGRVGELRQEAPGWVYRLEWCAQPFLGRQLARHYAANGTVLLLPGHLHNRTAGREALTAAGSPHRLMLLDTGLDPAVPARLQDLAAQTGLPAETLPVGTEALGNLLARTVLAWRLKEEQARGTAALSEAIRRSSDHALALDLIGDLARTTTEPEAIDSILDLFTLLFAPGRLLYVPWADGQPGVPRSRPPTLAEEEQALARLAGFPGDYAVTDSGAGFVLRIGHREETVGFLEVEELALPQHLEHYLNLAVILGRVCGLTIANTRSNERRIEAEEKIRHQAYHDPLTGLPNRLLFYDRLATALTHAKRSRQSLAVMFVDLDHFKQVNDSFGHDVGDIVLRQVGRRLQEAVRVADSVARLGGDEFLLLLPDVGRPEDALRVAQRVHRALERPFHWAGHALRIMASIGLALYPDDGQEVEELIKQADQAMYGVKAKGGDGCGLRG